MPAVFHFLKQVVFSIPAWGCLLSVLLFLGVFPGSPARAEMHLLEDKALSDVTASGFSQFTLTRGAVDIARIDLNLAVSTYTEAQSLQMGYWDNGSGRNWDQNWQTLALGSQANDLVLNGFVLETTFNDISDPANRTLQSITMGFSDVTGTISADLTSFTGTIKGVAHERANLGVTSITLANQPFLVTLEVDDGVSFKIGW